MSFKILSLCMCSFSCSSFFGSRWAHFFVFQAVAAAVVQTPQTSLSMIISRSTHVALMVLFHSFLWLKFHCMYHIFIHSSVDEHLGCFHALVIVNSGVLFYLYFSDDIECGAYFYLLLCHLYVFGEVSVKVFDPFFFFFDSFIELQFVCHTIHPFKVYI